MIAVNFSPQIPTANAYLFGRKEDREKDLTRNHMAGGSQLWSILKMVAISYLISSFMQEYLLSPKDKTDASSDDSGATTTAAQVALRNNNNNKKQASAVKAVPLTMLPDRVVVDFGFECRSGEELTFIACDKQSYVLEHEKLALPEASTSTSQDDNNNNNNGGAPTTRRQHLPLPGKRFWGLGQQLVNIHGSHNALISVEDIYKHNVTVRLVATISSNGRTVKRFLDLVRYAKPPKATKRLFGETSSSSTIVAPTPVDYPVLQQEVADSPSPTSSDPALATAVVTKRSTAPGGGDYLSLITDDALPTVAPPPLPLIQKFLPTVEFSCVAEATMFNPIPQPLEDTLDIDEKGRYFPICEFKTFWVIDSQFIVLNATTAVSGSDDAEGVSSNIEELEEGARHHPRGFVNFTIDVTNMPLWKFLVFTQMDKSFAMHETYGTMGSKEMDETKRIFLETNPWLLGLTFGVSMLHLLFEYLAFTNDVKFWKGRKNFTGLSLKSVVMEFYFSLIIFLYLFDGDETSWSVLAPSGVGVLIAFWKIKKAVVVTNLADKPTEAQPAQAASGAPSTSTSTSTSTALVPAVTSGATTDGVTVGTFRITFAKSYQSKTKEHDDQAMKYLMYVMVPCLIGYTAYSAYYDEHRGWYSFIIGTQVRFIYFFGFAMMTPQIFINYKLKSVTALPWRTFVYKALNTFIDDLFAFIIKMPTMHRLACFRDDIVFIILLYQRWIYPVDEKRSQDGDDDDEEGGEGNAANPTSSTTTAAASGAAAAAVPSTEELLKELKRIEEKNK